MNPEQQLARLLDGLGLQYDLESQGGAPVAQFRYRVAQGALLPFAVTLAGGILLLRVRVRPSPLPASELIEPLNQVNARWLLGRSYLDPEGWLGAATSVLARQAPSIEEPFRFAFAQLVRAAILLLRVPGCFAGLDDPDFSPANPDFEDSFASCFLEELESVPPASGDPLGLLSEWMKAINEPFERNPNGRQWARRYHVPGAPDRIIDLLPIGQSFLGVRARHAREVTAADPHGALQAATRLNHRFAIGNVVLDGARAVVLLTLPAAWIRIDEALARWLIDRAHAALAAVEREIPLRG